MVSVLFIGACTTLAIRKKDSSIVSSFIRVVTALCQWKILASLILFHAVVGGALLLAHKIGLWNPSLLKVTIIWLLVTGVGLCLKVSEALKKPTFFIDTLKQTVKISVVLQFIANLESFPLGLEIVVQLVAGMLALVLPLTRDEPRHAVIGRIAKWYFILLATAAIIWTGRSTVWAQVNHTEFLLELILPVWLTLVSVLYLYPLALYASHESTFVSLKRYSRVRRKRRTYRKMVAIVLRTGLSIRAARTIDRYAPVIVEADDFRSAWRESSRSIWEDRERIESERSAELRLVNSAGLVGTDQAGRQLDQREHAETIKALYWLATCQMGHYRNLQRYRKDKQFAGVVEYVAERHGLPTPTDIRLRVSADGQSWYAERKTITGHWFAIGAAAPPTDQWLYDGAARSASFPNEKKWDQWCSGEHSVNWDER